MDTELVINGFSAVGTFLAVLVALHLARRADAQREARDAKLQRMHALYLLPVLEGLLSDLKGVYTIVFFENETPRSMNEVNDRLNRVNKWALDFDKHSALEQLSPESLLLLPEIVALRVSRALGLLQSLKIEITRFSPEQWSNPPQAVAQKVKEWAGAKSLACDLIAVAIADLEAKANSDAVYPTGQELYGDPDDN